MPYLQNMCPKDLAEAQARKLPLLMGAGSIEYHGSQLPLGTDLFIVEGVLREIEKRVPAVIAPSFVYSPTGHAVSGPEQGTVDIPVDCFIDHCAAVLKNYERMGFSRIIVLVHHQGGNVGLFLQTAALKFQMYGVNEELGDGWWTQGRKRQGRTSIEVSPTILEPEAFGGHGGKGETEAIMALYPHLVHMEYLGEREPLWNQSVFQADPENARIQMERVVRLWVEKLNRGE